LFSTILTSAAVLVIGAGVSVAHAQPNAPSAVVPTITTLPLFGVQLTVEVATGPGGALTSVSINPADGFTATTVKPNKVVFLNEDGNAKVVVAGRDGRQGVQVKAGALADISGAGGWSGDVFGTGVATSVSFTVGATADGGPDITGISSSDATAVIGDVKYSNGDDDDHGHHDGHHEGGQSASVKVTFTSGAQSRSLGIRASLSVNEGGDTRAKVSVGLGNIRGVAQPVADAIGAKVWTGLLCDGSTATINYTVNEDGSITDVTASPEAERIRAEGHSADVKFSDDERVRIRTRSKDDSIAVQVDERIRCEDAPDPSVNTPIETTTTVEGDDDHQDDSGDDDHDDGDHDDDNHNGGDHNGGGRDGGGDDQGDGRHG
jgi:hypothetical protein